MSGTADGRTIALYRMSLAALGVIALVAFGGYSFFHLPDPASNTAFAEVALTFDASETMREAGVTVRQETWADTVWPIAALYLGFGIPIVLLLLALRYSRIAMAATAAIFLAATANATLFNGAVPYAVAAAGLDPEARRTLEASIANPDRAMRGASGQPAILDPRGKASQDEATRLFPQLARINPEAAKAALQEVQRMLEITVGSTDTSNIEKVGALTPSADIPTFGELQWRGGKAPVTTFQDLSGAMPEFQRLTTPQDGRARIKRVDESQKAKAAARAENAPSGAGGDFHEVKAVVPPLGGAHAAYTLAQVAYLEDRPADAKLFLEEIKERGAIGYYGHLQRLDLIRDWTAAKGYPVAAATSVGSAPPVMAETRDLANLLLQIAIAAFGLGMLPLAGWVLARRPRA